MDSLEVFLALIERGEEHLDLPVAWACLTSVLKESGDANQMLQQLTQLKRESREFLEKRKDSFPSRLACLNEFFVRKCRFQGNQASYLDPRNSYLDDLLERRLGIPITLSILYVEFGKAGGLEIDPINFPGHFLVQDTSSGSICDPFSGRIGLSQSDCLSIASRLFGGDVMWSEDFLKPASPLMILERMLANFRNSYASVNDKRRLERVESIFDKIDEFDATSYGPRAIH